MEKVISRDLLLAQFEAGPPAGVANDITHLLGYAGSGHTLHASAWVDTGIHDEEGWPAEFEPPAVYLQVCVRNCSGTLQYCRSIPASGAPLLAGQVPELIEDAIDTASRETHEWLVRLGAAVKSVKAQRSRIEDLQCATSPR